MKQIVSKFMDWYSDEFKKSSLFEAMNNTIEDSPWHREKNVATHTNMVVAEYCKLSNQFVTQRDWVIGAFASAFHDTGKPSAEETVESAERGVYRRYGGHELISSRIWEDWAATNWYMLRENFNMSAPDIYAVGWLIQNHLPYSVAKSHKVNRIKQTACFLTTPGNINLLAACLEADSRGRISDDHEMKIAKTMDWINNTLSDFVATAHFQKDAPYCYVLIGSSGSGKSTFSAQLISQDDDCVVHSMDALRLQWYSSVYSEAYTMSTEDKTFTSRVHTDFIDALKTRKTVIVDNVNGSSKRRTFYVDEARKKGYRVVAVLFPVARDVVVKRQLTRTDKSVPESAVISHYNNLQLPFIGEFDEMLTVDNNLPT